MKFHSILNSWFSITISSFCLYYFSFTIFPNGSLFKSNLVVFYTPFELTCCICLTHDLHSLQLFHTFYIYCFLEYYQIFAFMFLVLITCSCVANVNASVVLFKDSFLSHPHWCSLALTIFCLINCPCNCICVHRVCFSFILFILFVIISCFSIFIFFYFTCSN